MLKTITSGMISFVDTTDARKLSCNIASNLPTMQIYDQNLGTYSPNWSTNNLILSPTVFLDASNKTEESTYKWYRKYGSSTEQQISTSKNITINTNLTHESGMVTYRCEASYQDISATDQLIFTRINSGRDGTSVNILGSYATLSELQTAHPTGSAGDAYIISGRLYVWAPDDNAWDDVGNIQGPQGEAAKNIILNATGQLFKINKSNVVSPSIITVTGYPINTTITSWTYSTNGGQTFSSTVPTGVSRSNNQVTINGSSLTNGVVIKASDGIYSDTISVYKVADGSDGDTGNPGAPAPIAFLTNENITFNADSLGRIAATTRTSNVVAYIGTTPVIPTVGTIARLPSGMTASVSTVGNEVMVTLTIAPNATLGSNASNSDYLTIPVTIPSTPAISVNLTLNWSKVNAGRSVSSIAARYAISNSNTTAPTTWQVNMPARASGQYLWMADYITYDNNTNATVGARVVTGDTGNNGISVSSVVSYFANNQSMSTAPTTGWATTPSRQTGYYTWRKDQIIFSDNSTEDTTPVCITGDKGDIGNSGVSVSSITVEYAVSSSNTTSPTTGWSSSIPTRSENQYLWVRDVITLSNGNVSNVGARVVTGDKGDTGKGITSIIEEYYLSTSSTSQAGGSWSTMSPTWVDGKFIWTRSKITYTDGNTTTTSPICVTGGKGSTGGTGNGINKVDVQYYKSTSSTSLVGGSWSTTAPAWSDGTYMWSKTVTTYTNGTSVESTPICITGAKGPQGTSVTVSSTSITYQVGTSGTTKPTGTWSAAVPAVSENSYLWTKTVVTYSDGKSTEAYSVAYQGKSGTNVTISSTSVAYQVSSSGTTTPTGTWNTTVPSVGLGQFLWTRTIVTYSNGTSTTSYSVSYRGTNGTSYYVHIRYRANEGETTLSTEPNDYMGVYSGTSVTAPTTVSSYTWYNVKGTSGSPGNDAVVFQVYSNNGYILSKDLQTITLQTFAYKGSEAITSGATYQWASSVGNGWTNISGATKAYLDVVHTDVLNNKSYMCTMTFEGLTYSYVVTVEDKADIKQVFTSKPTSYSEGDIWMVGQDYIPNGFAYGSILKADQTRDVYSENDWIAATDYDKKINQLTESVATYNQFFSFDKVKGLSMSAVDSTGKRSPFSTTLSNNKLSFNEGAKEVAYISNEKLNITEAEIVSPLTVTGSYSGNSMLQAPTINIGNFSIIVESNGSLSIVAKS